MRRHWPFLLACLGLIACERGNAPAGEDQGQARRERGQLLSLACMACHSFGPGEAHQIGPNLFGVFGREAGAADGFSYSAALRSAQFVWTPAELDRWLADPAGFLPGTTMTFTGYQSAEDRAALIDHLVEATAKGP